MPLNNPITPALLADPEIFQQNRLPFHAHFADQTSPEMPLVVSLDGAWSFRYAENLTAPFSEWDTLTVPGFIQLQSLQKPGHPYGTPHYVNTQYPWDGHEKLHPGEIPQAYNPIGEYRRSFTLPENWASCYLRLNGADSAAAVWCNGVYIGYTEDAFTPAEFDMTAAIHPGENTLTVQVYRFCSGSWLEDQDFWRMSGLFRSVELFTKPEVHLEDVFVKQSFADDFSSATVTFDCKVSGAGTISVVFDGEEQSAEVGEPAEYDSGVVFGKGEADPDVEEDVQDVSFTFAVGSALAGIGSVLYCCSYPQATPTMGSMLGLKAFVAAVLGGIGSIPGAMIGGIAIGLCECFVSAIGLSAWKDAVTFAILIIVLLVKPTGFLGRKVQEKV